MHLELLDLNINLVVMLGIGVSKNFVYPLLHMKFYRLIIYQVIMTQYRNRET